MSKESTKQKAEALLKDLSEGRLKPKQENEFYFIDLSSFIGEIITAPSKEEVINKTKERLKKLIKIEEDSKKISNIYRWATKLTAESKSFGYKYYCPAPIKRLLDRLSLVSGNLICLQGLQGSGKSTALQEMRWKIKDEMKNIVVHFKWPGGNDPFESIFNVLLEDEESFEDKYKDFLVNKIEFRTNDERMTKKLDKLNPCDEDLEKFTYEELERLFSIGERKKLRKKFLMEFLGDCDTILIDTRDYSRSDRRIMNTDLMAIQNLWDELVHYAQCYDGEVPNLVFAFQKELVERKDSFFFGKMDIVELKPLTPQQLIEAYKLNFESVWPFEEEALLRIARLSRGIFRRFLRYIGLCIEEYLHQGDLELINIPLTEKAVTNEEISKDMDLELSSLFPKGEMMKKAIKILSFLTNTKEGLNQKQLAKALNLNEMDCSRLCDKLEEHGYIIRESSKEGKIVKTNI